MIPSNRLLVTALAVTFLPFFGGTAFAQSKKGAEFIAGTVVSIEKAKVGKNYLMKIKNTADDEEFDVPLLPKTQLYVSAKGDEGFLRPNVFVQTTLLQTNNEFFAGKFTVLVGGNTQAYAKPDPTDKTVFEISGKIQMTDAKGMIVQCPAPRKITFEETKEVTVKIADPTLIKEGDKVDVEGTLIKSKKQINATTVNVTSETEVNADEYFASVEERKKPKSAKSKSSKSKTDSAGGGTGLEAGADPFATTKKKGTKAKDDKADGEAGTDEPKTDKDKKAAKEDATKDDTSEDEAAKDIPKKDDDSK